MTSNRPLGAPLRCATALALCCATVAAQAASWTSIAFIPANQVSVSFDRNSPTTVNGLTRAWFLFSYPRPVTTAESFVFKSYKEYEVIDCKQHASFTASFAAYSEDDGGGRLIYTWSGPNAVLPALEPAEPGSVRALMIDAACAPPPKRRPSLPPIPPAPDTPTSGVAAQAPASPMADPRPITVRPLP